MILVPQNKICFARAGGGSPDKEAIMPMLEELNANFDTGIDSPVSIDSFTIASPESNSKSAGNELRLFSETSMTSPGTSSAESAICPTT